jgi:hypothetical protein
MQIPMVVKERTVRVQASIPVSQADALKALAAASGVPLARAVQYAVERLLEVAGEDGVLAVTGGLAPAGDVDAGGDSVAEVAAALDLRVPDPELDSRDPVARNGQPTLVSRVAREGEQCGEPRAGQGPGQPQQPDPEQAAGPEGGPAEEQAGDALSAPPAGQPGGAVPDAGADVTARAAT